MPVTKQVLPIAFAQGIDTKTDPKQLQAGPLLELENGVFTKMGQINKRFGYDILVQGIEGTNNTISSGVALSAFNDELLAFDGYKVYAQLPSTGNWIDRGTAISVIESNQQIIRVSDAQQLSPDCGVLNGVQAYAWEDSRGGVRYSLIDQETKTFIISDASIDTTAERPKVITFNNQIFVFYVRNQNVSYVTINAANPTLLGPSTSVLDDGYAIGNLAYDVAVIGNKMCLGYLSNGVATGEINFFYYDTNLVKSSVTTVEATAGKAINNGFQGAVNIVGDSQNNIWISWADGIKVRTAAYSNNISVQLADTIVDTCACVALAGVEDITTQQLHLFYEVFNANVMNEQVRHRTISLTGVLGNLGTVRSVGLASKPFKYNGVVAFNAAFQSELQSTYFTITSGHAVIAKISPGLGGGLINNNMVPEIVATDAGIYVFGNLVRGRLNSEAGNQFSFLGVNSTVIDFQHTNRFLSAILGNNLFIAGAVLQSYDGVSAVEHGYHVYPEGITAVASGSDGYLSAGDYQYIITFEWTDNRGQVQISTTSVPVEVTVSANNHVTLTIPTLRLTAKTGNRSDCRIVVYRNTAAGSVFYQVSSNAAPLMNNVNVDSVQFVDVLADSDITANAIVYTNGGVLDNSGPPACSLIETYRNRVFIAGTEDKNKIYYSKNKFENDANNTIPVEFSDFLTIGVDPRGGGVTGLGLLDDKLIIFKDESIFFILGNGPTDTGDNSDYGDPELISSDYGCVDPNSIVVMPLGIMFKSRKGITLLGRDTSTKYIGSPVEKYNSLSITSATLDPDANLVIFTTDNGPALVYDYYFNQWVTWTNHAAQDSDVFKNNLVFIKSDGSVFLQNEDKFTDGASPIYLKWTTANISLAGMQGYQRVFNALLLGSYKSPHKLQVNVAYDFNNTYTQTTTIDVGSLVGQNNWGSDGYWGDSSMWGGNYVPYEIRIDFKTQKCTAIRISVSELQTDSYGEGYAVSNLAFQVGLLPGANRVPPSSTFGVS